MRAGDGQFLQWTAGSRGISALADVSLPGKLQYAVPDDVLLLLYIVQEDRPLSALYPNSAIV